MPVQYSQAKKRLGILWFSVSGCLTVIFAFMTIGKGGFQSHSTEAWGWFIQSLLPSLGLMVGVLIADGQAQNNAQRLQVTSDVSMLYGIAMGCSCVYLLLVTAVLFWEAPVGERLAALQQSTVFLGPLQGLLATLLGFFFVRSKPPGPARRQGTSGP
ncbi:hypothetical protein [Pelomonas cellulosilytica]|uniref:Uncharacterized protein n=1 Tax=Pelomonas cellulosilytica TaxID=2906762 RepID=A0ABS8XNB1_9BURK|nr:hypothetical protein [Pelomonas sp. P8]MCE4554254.1 hypothetical protein [Pelomonas sp. P8]